MSSFRYILTGRTITNIGDSILYIYLTYSLAQMTGSFKQLLVVISIGEIIAIIYSVKRAQKNNYVSRLIRIEIIQAIITVGIFVAFNNFNSSYGSILFYILVMAFYVLNPLSYSIDALIISKLENFDRHNYFTKYSAVNKTIDLLANLFTTFIILYLDILTIGILDTLSFLISIIFIRKITFPKPKTSLNNQVVKLKFKNQIKRLLIKEIKIEIIVVWLTKFIFAMYIVNSIRIAENFTMFSTFINYSLILGSITFGYSLSLLLLRYHFKAIYKFRIGLLITLSGLIFLTFIKSNIIIFVIGLAYATIGLALLTSFYNNALAKVKESDYHKEMRYIVSVVAISLISTAGYIIGEFIYTTAFIELTAILIAIIALVYYLQIIKHQVFN